MDKYDILQQIGDGTFGSVAKAVHRKTGQLVAIKRMKQKYFSWEECVALPEVQVLRKLQSHPNVIKLREVIRENNELFFVFEFMDGDLLGVIRKHKQMANPALLATSSIVPYQKVKSYMFQLMQSLAFLHRSGYFHRDLKPENLLIKKDPLQNGEVVKLADFGLVKEVRARPPFTDYVSTRWYRAPELLLQDRAYNTPVDVWAAGCIFSELLTTRPLFPGNNEVDQLYKIMSLLGTPTEAAWPEGIQLARKIRYQFPHVAATPLKALYPSHIPPAALDLLSKMLVYDPKKRLTAQQCLQHPYFSVSLDEEQLGVRQQGTQSAPNPQLYSAQPVQWQRDASSLPTIPAQTKPAQQPPQRPASGSRPIFPPVEISKHQITNNNNNGNTSSITPQQQQGNYSQQPTYHTHVVKDAISPMPARAPNTVDATPSPPPQKPQHDSLPSVTKPAKTVVKADLDLDELLEDFSKEMNALGYQTKRQEAPTTKPKEQTTGADPMGKPPGGAASRTSQPMLPVKAAGGGAAALRSGAIPSSSNIAAGLPDRGAPSPSAVSKLLSNQRYRPSLLPMTTSSSPAHNNSSATPQNGAGPMVGSSGFLLNPHAIASPTAATAANRYEVDSTSFASFDLSSNTYASSTRKAGGGGGPTTMVSPSVHMVLAKSNGIGPLPPSSSESETPSWLKVESNRKPTEFGKGAPLPQRR